jgi:hypothetical protein
MRAHFETLSKEDLIDTLLNYKARYEREKLEAEWLDESLDALRNDEDAPDMPSKEMKDVKDRHNSHIINESLKL